MPGGGPERLYLWAERHPGAVDLLLAVALGALLIPSSLSMIAPGAAPGWWAVLRGSLVVLHAAPVARRTRPLFSFCLVSAALAAQTVTPLATYRSYSGFLPSALVFLVALYSLCLYGPPRERGFGVLVGVAGSVMITVRTAWAVPERTNEVPGGDAAWAFLLGALLMAVLACWGSARFRHVRMSYLALLEERARRAEADREERTQEAIRLERARIARDIHDIVAHALAVIVTQAQGGALIAAKAPERAAGVLDTIASSARQALSDMRTMLGVLRTHPAAEIDPRPTLADLDRLLAELATTGLNIHRVQTGTPREIGPTAELTVYRIAQEALTNTLRHAGPAARAELALTWTAAELTVTITDDGPGCGGPEKNRGHGLIGMRERVAVLGGRLSVGSGEAGGFRVRAAIPLAGALTGGPET